MWFIFDMDGTLLKDNHQISEKNEMMLNELVAHGHNIGVSTGRPFNTIKKAIPSLYSKLTYISAYNGALIHYEDKVIESKVSFNNLNEFKQSTPIKFAITFGKEDDLHTDSHGLIIEDIISRNNPNKIIGIKNIDEVECHVLRLIVEDPSKLKELTALAKEFFKDCNVTSSTGIFVLISTKNASKAKALEVFNNNETIFFFGDSGNDEDVFNLRQENIIKVAPKNATEKILNMADIVLSTTNNDGFNLNEFFPFKRK